MEAMAHYLNYIENNNIIIITYYIIIKENNEYRLVGKEEE
jgi:hypothetical protein